MNDHLASVIRMEKTFMTPIFSITDPQGQRIVRLKGRISETALFQVIYIFSLVRPFLPVFQNRAVVRIDFHKRD